LVNAGVRGGNLRQLDKTVNQQTGSLTIQKGDPLGIALKNEITQCLNDEISEPMPGPASMPHRDYWELRRSTTSLFCRQN